MELSGPDTVIGRIQRRLPKDWLSAEDITAEYDGADRTNLYHALRLSTPVENCAGIAG